MTQLMVRVVADESINQLFVPAAVQTWPILVVSDKRNHRMTSSVSQTCWRRHRRRNKQRTMTVQYNSTLLINCTSWDFSFLDGENSRMVGLSPGLHVWDYDWTILSLKKISYLHTCSLTVKNVYFICLCVLRDCAYLYCAFNHHLYA